MAKVRSSFVCQGCGAVHVKWYGKCPDCGEWDSLEEVREGGGEGKGVRDPQRGLAEEWVWGVGAGGADGVEVVGGAGGVNGGPKAVAIGEIEALAIARWATGIGEFDRVLGGGFVPGSVILLGGEPGIGKSTLMLQAGASLAASGRRVLYVTSEESAQQAQMRASRLELVDDDDRLFVLADTNLARIFEQVRVTRPSVVVIDSVQMVYKSSVDASPGSITQLRRCCMELVYLAKSSGCCVVLVGHVTKEGRVAGPRLLEHLVDSVLYFEGEQYHAHRVVRAVKNRYGNTLEIGLFEMTGRGLMPIESPTGLVCRVGGDGDGGGEGRAGSVMAPVMQGSRCFMVELQALTTTGILGAAKRRVSGLDANRLAMLIAVLEKHGGLRLADQDVFTSSVGGLRVVEPAGDLPICLAIAGAHYNRAVGGDVVAVGEVGLGGEIRRVNQLGQRLREAARLGYRRAIVPAGNDGGGGGGGEVDGVGGMEVAEVRTVNEALAFLE